MQLSGDNRCKLYGKPERPAVCSRLQPSREMCGEIADEALRYLNELELLTAPLCTPS